MLDSIWQGFRLTVRHLRRNPAFAATVIVTLALAIGASTAIFSFVNTLLVRPFPFRDPEQLVEIRSVRGGQPGKISMREILDIQEYASSVGSIAAHTGDAGGYNFGGNGGHPEEWRAILTTGTLFEVLGVPLAAGTAWPQLFDRTRDNRVILSYGVWQRQFGGRHDVVGQTITLDHAPGYRVDGVAPKGIDFPRGIDVYRSLGGFANYERREARNAVGIARLKPDRSIARLQAELDVLAHNLAERFPTSNEGVTFRATSFRSIYSGDVQAYLLLLMGAVAFVLLIACANVANLQLSRAVSREQEIAVRVALGAGRRAIVGQMLMESAVPAMCAAVLGVSLAYWCIDALRALIGPRIPEWMQVHVDGRVLAFAALTTIVAAIGSGLAPALHAYRQSPGGSLKEASRGATGGRAAASLRNALVVAEVALAVMLIAGAGLLIRGFLELQSQQKGFTSTGLATFRVALGWGRYGGDAVTRYYERALEDLAAIPGVHGVGFIYSPPLAGLEFTAPNTVQAEWQSVSEALRNPYVHSQSTSEIYFEVMDIPLRSGRRFSAFDRKDTQPVAIISERLAQILWPGQNAIGQRLRFNPLLEGNNPYRTVVGVVGNVHHRELGGDPSLEMYVPFRQTTQANQFLIAKTSLPFAEFRARAERAMWAIDAEQSMFDFQTYDDRIMAGIWQIRISRLILMLFGGVALLLSGLGIYGVLSHLVGQRTRELGIRLALGATPASLRLLVVRRALVLSGVGLAIGCGGAFVLGRFMAQMIRGLSGFDPLGMAATLVTLLTAVLAASALPAWRASRTDPVMTLRGETHAANS